MADVLNSGDEPVTNKASLNAAVGQNLLAETHQPVGVNPQPAGDRFRENDTSKLAANGFFPQIEGGLPKWTENQTMRTAAAVFDKSFDNTRRQLINTV